MLQLVEFFLKLLFNFQLFELLGTCRLLNGSSNVFLLYKWVSSSVKTVPMPSRTISRLIKNQKSSEPSAGEKPFQLCGFLFRCNLVRFASSKLLDATIKMKQDLRGKYWSIWSQLSYNFIFQKMSSFIEGSLYPSYLGRDIGNSERVFLKGLPWRKTEMFLEFTFSLPRHSFRHHAGMFCKKMSTLSLWVFLNLSR